MANSSPATEKQNLSAEDWAEAALDVMATAGIEAVAVEPLARRLNVTKGSFYWHFANRGALITAALELWEQRETEDIFVRAEQVTDPYERIVKVFKEANSSYRSGRLYLALAAASDNPQVAEVVSRVSHRRLSYLYECYRALGMHSADARHWSRFAYATFIGNLQIWRDAPDAVPSGAAFSDYIKLMIRTLIPRELKDASAQDAHAVLPIRKTGSD